MFGFFKRLVHPFQGIRGSPPDAGGEPEHQRGVAHDHEVALRSEGAQVPAAASSSRRSAGVVTGRRQVNPRQTYAAGAPPTRPRPASSGADSRVPSPSARTDPGGAACSAARSRSPVRGSSDGPAIAISTGPASSASATARPVPQARGYFPATGASTPSAAAAAARCRAEPVRDAYASSASAAANAPEGVAPSSGSA